MMESRLDTSKLPAYFFVENAGKADVDDMLSMWKSVLNSDKWRPGMGVLIDNRRVKTPYTYNANPSVVAGLLATQQSELGPARIAIVMPLEANDAYMHEFATLTNSKLTNAQMQYFYSDIMALNWLYSAPPLESI